LEPQIARIDPRNLCNLRLDFPHYGDA
jgi:hypothetical protein